MRGGAGTRPPAGAACLPATAQCSFSPQPGNWAHAGCTGGSEGEDRRVRGTVTVTSELSLASDCLEARLPSLDPLPAAPHIMNHDTVIQ